MQAFIGEQWKLVLGAVFVLIVIFLPGGFIDGYNRIRRALGIKTQSRRQNVPDKPERASDIYDRKNTARDFAD